MKNKKSIIYLMIFVMMLGLLSACQSESKEGESTYRLSFGGAGASTSAYIIAVAYGEIINNQVDGVEMTIEETGGGIDNVNMMEAGELDGGVANLVAAYAAFRGINEYEGQEPYDSLRSWVPQYTWPIQMVVRAESDIYTIYDLKGKKVGVDIVGRGAEVSHRDMFTSLGMSYDDFNNYHISMQESLDLLRTGDIDSAFISTAAPTAVLVEFGTTTNFRLINLSQEDMEKVSANYPYYFPGVVPGGTYEGIPEDTHTIVGYTNSFIHRDVPEEIVYSITKAVWENMDRLIEAHPSQRLLDRGMVEDLGAAVPLHPGAERYFREIGLID